VPVEHRVCAMQGRPDPIERTLDTLGGTHVCLCLRRAKRVTSVKMVEIGLRSEVAIGHAALGGIWG
jgi:hypothetical protein